MTKMNVPKLRFKGFSGEWEEETISDIASIKTGSDVDKSLIEENGKFPVIANNLKSNGIIGYYNDYYNVDYDCVTVTARGTLGIPKARNYKFVAVGRLLVLKSKLDRFFLEKLISTLRIFNESTGVPQLTGPQFGKYKVIYPKNNEEQKKIGLFFQKIDKLIELQTKRLEALKKLKQGYLQKMFPQDGEKVPRLRFREFSGEWKEDYLYNLGTVYGGLTGKNKDDFGNGNYQYLPYLSVNKNFVSSDKDTEVVNISTDEKQNVIRKNDVLFTISSETPEEVGMSSAWLGDKESYLNSFSFGYRFKDETSGYYTSSMFRSRDARKKIYPLAQGISRYNLSKKYFMNLKFRIPLLSEQKEIGSFIYNMDNIINSENEKLLLIKKQKKAYLQKMFM